jgi:hypothetical protein
MRFQIMCKHDSETEFTSMFEVDGIEDAKQIAIRAAMRPCYTVYVYDAKLGERVTDFDAEKYL